MKLFLCSHFSSVGSLIKEEYERIAGQMKKSAQEIEQNLVRP